MENKEESPEDILKKLELMNNFNKLANIFIDSSYLKLSNILSEFNVKMTKDTIGKDITKIDKDFTPVINVIKQAMSIYDDIMKGEGK